MVFDSYNNSFVHLVADYFANTCFSKISFHDLLLLSRLLCCICLLGNHGLDSGNIFTNLFDSACIVQLVGCILEISS